LRFTPFTDVVRSPRDDRQQARPAVTGSAVRHVMEPAVVALAYYLGARVGFLFTLPAVPQSVLWLPNSILLAALLVSPPRRWPVLLAAAFPAQMLVAWQSGAPFQMMSLLFVTNCADAALGATLWRVLSRGEPRLEGLRPMLTFLVVAAVPTILLSFADAWITVATVSGADYWLAWATRVRANVLTNVIFVPAALALVGADRGALWQRWRTRYREGLLLFAGLVAMTWLTLSRPDDLVSTAALAYLPLPFLLWAALRFGVGVTSGTLLVLAYLTTWFMVRGVGTLALAPPADIVPALQIHMLAIAVPILCLAAVVQERERAASALTASQNALDRSLARLRNLGGRLLRNQEAERSRIARELHDDVSQHVAALGIALSNMKRRLPAESEIREEITQLQAQAMMVADGVRALSHELHPAALRHAGLLPALRELVSQFDRRESMHADLIAEGREVVVPPDVALCVYRVTQEALRNVARHSGARAAEVKLVVSDAAVDLTISDQGVGFDEEEARRRGGLGLTSIDERVRLVSGTVKLSTSPGHGTRLVVHVPHGDRHDSTDRPARG
jgi:two-component system sensor histidine kinase UhpB